MSPRGPAAWITRLMLWRPWHRIQPVTKVEKFRKPGLVKHSENAARIPTRVGARLPSTIVFLRSMVVRIDCLAVATAKLFSKVFG